MIETYKWSKFRKSELYSSIINEWERMLNDETLKEQDYHNFLFKNPSLFFTFYDAFLVMSKIKLGMDYETDFVVVEEGYSDGTIYELIEIETPHTKLFDSKGKPTARFNSSLQQIRDWKRFLINNKPFMKKTFPTSNTKIIRDSKLKFKIVIGRTTDNLEELEKRRQIAEQENIEIISFDRLTEFAKHRKLFFDEATISAAQMNDVPYYKKNQLANPFYECISDATWRQICRNGHSHFYSNNLDIILENRTYNEHFEIFKQIK